MDATAAPSIPTAGMLLDEVVESVQGVDETINQLMAMKVTLLAAASRIVDEERFDDLEARELAHRAVAADIAAAVRVPDRTMQAQMGDAAMLSDRFPATLAAFGAGEISQAHVRIILETGMPIEAAQAREAFEKLVVEKARAESANRLRPFAKQLSERFRDESFTERQRRAHVKRGVRVRELADGQAELIQTGPSVIIHAEHDRLTQLAKAVVLSSGIDGVDDFEDQRTMAQLRSDILSDLILTGTPTGHTAGDRLLGEIRAHIDVTVPVLTLTDPDDQAAPGHLEGVGPIDPATARILVAQTPGFDRVLTHPISGVVMAVDRYRPSKAMRRHLRARDRRCRFPGCRLVARECDIDHTRDHAYGGETSMSNLADLCRRHHVTKHQTPWKVTQLAGGELEWTSPTGRVHIDRPPGIATAITADDIRDRIPPPF